jgi:hypothetical protein
LYEETDPGWWGYSFPTEYPSLSALRAAYPEGIYTLDFYDSGGELIKSVELDYSGIGEPSSPVDFIYPSANGQTGISVNPTFRWSVSSGAGDALMMVLEDDVTGELVYLDVPVSISSTSWKPDSLSAGREYELDVSVINIKGWEGGTTFPTMTDDTGDQFAYGLLVEYMNEIEFTANPASSITTSKSVYQPGQTIVVIFSGAPGNATDWIGLYAEGNGNGNYITYLYTDGDVSGSVVFSNGLPSPGSYEARLFPNNSYNVATVSETFTVGTVVTTDQDQYDSGEPITVSFSGAPGNDTDWIGLYAEGAGNGNYKTYLYTGGTVNGSVVFSDGLPSPGTYEARLFPNNSYNVASVSETFTVGTVVTTDQDQYDSGESITVSFSGAPGNDNDWIGLFLEGGGSWFAWCYTDGTKSGTAGITNGTVTFSGGLSTPGDYEARLFFNDSWNVEVTAQFSVGY